MISKSKPAPVAKTFTFRIKTKAGSLVGNIEKVGTSLPEAVRNLRKQYPDCTIINVHER